MELIYKQLFKQIVKDKIYLFLLLSLITLTSFSFFFVMISVDGNIWMLNKLQNLTNNQQMYKNALDSNTTLAYIFWASLVGFSIVVFIMFFYRFFRANKRQMGCIKALGFKNSSLQFFFIIFTAIISVLGASLGLFGGYALSDILLKANSRTYGVTGLVKGISRLNLAIGIFFSTVLFCITACLCYGFMRNKEDGLLLAGSSIQNRFPLTLRISDKISRMFPKRRRLPLRIALCKPLSIFLLLTSVMSFNVFIILGQSLNISSNKIFRMQTEGHHYDYQIKYQGYKTSDISSNAIMYIDNVSTLIIKNYELERTITGLYNINALYELKNKDHNLLSLPNEGCVYINPELSEVYGVAIGETIALTVANKEYRFFVEDIAVNAQTNHIYIGGEQLAEILNIVPGSYNGAFTSDNSSDKLEGDTVIDKLQRIEDLNRNSVSNKVSAVINQITGVLVGFVLIFLALHISFQDNTHDVLILNMLGHSPKYVRKLLIDIYLPILWVMFCITLLPSIILAQTIQNALSISTNDYIPFSTDSFVIMIAFGLLNLIYYTIRAIFSLRIKRVVEKERIMEIIYAE